MEPIADRRTFLTRASQVIVGSAAGGVLFVADAAAQRGAYQMSGDTKGKCATCAFWGGKRRVSPDRKTVFVQSLGWCNNPASPNFQKTTTPETGPMDTWRKWEALS
jgi:anaerobic selenocysteine-containing dehydrogenase